MQCVNHDKNLTNKTNKGTARTFTSRVNVHVLCVEGALGLGGHVVIGVTTQTYYQVQISFLLDFVVHFCTCNRLYSVIVNSLSVANYCTLLHRENGSFEVLSLQRTERARVALACVWMQLLKLRKTATSQHVKEPVPSDGVDVDLAALRTTAAGLVFNECSGWGGWGGCGGTGSFDVVELLVCERPVDGFSPPGRALQADTMRKLVVEDVVLKSAFPELLPAGPTARLLRVPVWWPTQTNRQGDGGALGRHVVERGGIQIERRRGALADEAVHGKHFTVEKHLFGSGKAEKNEFFMIQTVTSWKQTCRSRSKVIAASQ